MKEKYDVPIAPLSEFVSYMMEQMSHFGLPCTEEQAKDFYLYYARMIETNKYLNLTGITDMKEVVIKHMIDSLSCYHQVWYVYHRYWYGRRFSWYSVGYL